MFGLDVVLAISLAMLVLLSLTQVGSVTRNSIVAVGFLQMITMMLILAIVFFVIKKEEIDFRNLIQVVSISFFATFILSFIMVRQTVIRARDWQTTLAIRVGDLFAPFLNVLFADPKGGDQEGSFPHILNMTGLTDAPQLLIGNGSAINNTRPINNLTTAAN